MRMTEAEILEQLSKIFPNKIIFAEQYSKGRHLLTFGIYKQAKAEGLSSIQWLTSKGYLWKETGYVEPDMHIRDAVLPSSDANAFEIADHVFRRYPLAGEYVLTNKEDRLLYQSASETVKKILLTDTRITAQEDVVLVLETINLLKNWSTELSDEETSGTFWNYIFLQYGFNPENSEAAKNRLYAHFQSAIKSTLIHYKRFFAPTGTQRYYTSLLLHALAPKQSIESLFAILFDFYVKNLDFQYIVEDISYKVFTKSMRARWDSRIAKNDGLQLRADAIFSGLQTLFKERPGYMAVLCDSIVKKMDALLRGEGDELLDPDRNYWDALLLEWYQKKSTSERVQAQGERRQRKPEYVATTAERIYVQYAMEHSTVGLAVSRIRLPQVGGQRPIIRVYQDESCIFEDELSVTGNDLCLTTKSRFISFEETAYNFSELPTIQVEIQYIGNVLYHSFQKLYRDYILFDTTGSERTPHKGTTYLFTGDRQEVGFSEEEGVYRCPYPGQLYRINLDEVSSASVDGREIFASATAAAQFRHHTSIRKVKGARILEQGKSADIFSAPFELSILLPKGERAIRYQLSIDRERCGAEKFKRGENELAMPSSDDGKLHCIRVVDLATDFVKYEYNYVILHDFRIQFDKPVYCAGVDQITTTITCGENQFTALLPLIQAANSGIMSLPGFAWQLELDAPVAHCSFMDSNAFSAPAVVWHKDIPSGEFMQLSLPDGWTGQVMLGTTAVPTADGKAFELGNMLRASLPEQNDADLWLSLNSQHGEHIHRKIATIAFKPTFLTAPLEVIDGKLLWQAENNYIGDPDSQLTVEYIDANGGISTRLVSDKNGIFADVEGLTPGSYSYRVFLKKKSLFAAKPDGLIFSGAYFIGEPKEWMYKGKELLLGEALCWNFDSDALKTVFMQPGCGVLADLSYQGTSIASGETAPAPCYSATMYYVNSSGRYIPFNSKPLKDFELVNPVMLWIVNEHLLILRCATEDTVYIDKRYSTIVNRSPSAYMSKAEQKERLETPDYFEYKIREGYRHV